MTQSFIINNCDGVHLRQPVEGGIGEQNAIQPQFLMPVRIMPDFDIFTDGPATVLAVLNLWIQISQTAGASGDWWHIVQTIVLRHDAGMFTVKGINRLKILQDAIDRNLHPGQAAE